MLTKRRVVLMAIVIVVLALLAGGIAWHIRKNTGVNLLARADLAVQAGKFDKALDLARDYIATHPDDWRGYRTRALAFSRQGKYDLAREVLAEGLRRRPDNAWIALALADTYSQPVTPILAVADNRRDVGALRRVLAMLGEANKVLREFRSGSDADAVLIREAVGLNLRTEAEVGRILVKLLEQEVQLAERHGSPESVKPKREECDEARAALAQARQEAVKTLLEVIRKDASRAAAAQALVAQCIENGDRASLEEARRLIRSSSAPPPMAVVRLALDQLDAAGDANQPDRAKKINEAIRQVDGVLAGHPDHVGAKVTRAELALMNDDANTAERLASEVLRADRGNLIARLCHGRSLLLRGKSAEAELELFALKNEAHGWVQAQYWYGVAADAVGKSDTARESMRAVTKLEASVRDHPASLRLVSRAHKVLAAHLLRDFPAQAFDDAKAAYDSDPNDALALALFVGAAQRTGQPNLARGALAGARTRRAGDSVVLDTIRNAYLAMGDAREAAETAEAASKLKPVGTAELEAVVAAMSFLGRGGEADRLLSEAVAMDPNNASLQFLLGRRYEATGRDLQSVEPMRRAVELDRSRRAEYRLALARALANTAQPDEAILVLAPILSTSREAQDLDAQQRVLRGDKMGDQRLFGDRQSGPERGLAMAAACRHAGDLQRCIEVCRTALDKKDANGVGWHLLLGQAYLEVDKVKECVEAWSKGVAAHPNAWQLYSRLASVLARDVPPQEARSKLAKTSGARKELVDFAVGDLHYQRKEFLRAAELYGDVAANAGASEAVRYLARANRAWALSLGGKVDDGVAEMDRLVAQGKLVNQTLHAKAKMLGAVGRADQAETVLNRLLQAAEQARDAREAIRVAEALGALGRYPRALAACDLAERLLPNEAASYLLRVRILAAMGQTEALSDLYRKAIPLQPANLDLYVALAAALDARGDPAGVLAALKQLEGQGQAARDLAMFERGNYFARWGLKRRALACFSELLSQATPRAQLALADRLANLGDSERARALLVKTPDHAPYYVPTQIMLAMLIDPNKTADKLATLEGLAGKRPGDPRILAARLRVLTDANRPAEAVQAFTRFLTEQHPQKLALARPAAMALWAALRIGDAQAAHRLTVLLQSVSDSPAWQWMGLGLLMETDPNAAAKALPLPADANSVPAMLGLCLARQSSNGRAAEPWAARIEAIAATQPAATQPAGGASAEGRLLCALLLGDARKIAVAAAAAMPRAAEDRAAQEELIAHAATARDAYAEIALLLKAHIALEFHQHQFAWHWAMRALRARPTCQWAGVLLLRSLDLAEQFGDPIPFASKDQVAELLRPNDCMLALAVSADVHAASARFAEAARCYAKLAAADANNPVWALRRAMAQEQTGDLRTARATYLEAWEARRDPVAGNNWAYLTARAFADGGADANDMVKAQKIISDLLGSEKVYPAFFDTAGWIAHLQGRKADACRLLRRAIQHLPGSAEVHYHLGMAEAAADNRELASLHLNAAVWIGEEQRRTEQTDRRKVLLSEALAARLAGEALYKLRLD
jgi:tetratricopeptide (TPR) repeat protein